MKRTIKLLLALSSLALSMLAMPADASYYYTMVYRTRGPVGGPPFRPASGPVVFSSHPFALQSECEADATQVNELLDGNDIVTSCKSDTLPTPEPTPTPVHE